jgi:acyl-coenzyme A synthetase/AMP-(fatty) acid ligase
MVLGARFTLNKYNISLIQVSAETGVTYTYSDVYIRSQSLAHSLIEHLRIQPDEVILAAIPTCIDAPIVLLATLQSGAALSVVNPMYNYGITMEIIIYKWIICRGNQASADRLQSENDILYGRKSG